MPGDLMMKQHKSGLERLQIVSMDVPSEMLRSPGRQHSSRFQPSESKDIERLPQLLDVSPSERPRLLSQKIEQCNIIFDFEDASADVDGKEIKRETLSELVEYISKNRGVLTEDVYPEFVNMVNSADVANGMR